MDIVGIFKKWYLAPYKPYKKDFLLAICLCTRGKQQHKQTQHFGLMLTVTRVNRMTSWRLDIFWKPFFNLTFVMIERMLCHVQHIRMPLRKEVSLMLAKSGSLDRLWKLKYYHTTPPPNLFDFRWPKCLVRFNSSPDAWKIPLTMVLRELLCSIKILNNTQVLPRSWE